MQLIFIEYHFIERNPQELANHKREGLLEDIAGGDKRVFEGRAEEGVNKEKRAS
jgi:hypothetical protein